MLICQQSYSAFVQGPDLMFHNFKAWTSVDWDVSELHEIWPSPDLKVKISVWPGNCILILPSLILYKFVFSPLPLDQMFCYVSVTKRGDCLFYTTKNASQSRNFITQSVQGSDRLLPMFCSSLTLSEIFHRNQNNKTRQTPHYFFFADKKIYQKINKLGFRFKDYYQCSKYNIFTWGNEILTKRKLPLMSKEAISKEM